MSNKKTIDDYTDAEIAAMPEDQLQSLLSDYFKDQDERGDGFPSVEYKPKQTPAKNQNTGFNVVTYGSGKQSVFMSKCRHSATDAFILDEVTYAGASRYLVEDESFDTQTLVVCLLGDPVTTILTDDEEFAKLRAFERDTTHHLISIKWRDYGAPPVGPGFWRSLHETAKTKGIKRIIFYCEGGHGRTGTALASALVEIYDYYPLEAMSYVRKAYCKEAIESQDQITSLKAIYRTSHPSATFEDMKGKK
jgi:protein-tyrosine phosphatase